MLRDFKTGIQYKAYLCPIKFEKQHEDSTSLRIHQFIFIYPDNSLCFQSLSRRLRSNRIMDELTD